MFCALPRWRPYRSADAQNRQVRRRTGIAAHLRTVINAGRPYTINNRRSGRLLQRKSSSSWPRINGRSESSTCSKRLPWAALDSEAWTYWGAGAELGQIDAVPKGQQSSENFSRHDGDSRLPQPEDRTARNTATDSPNLMPLLCIMLH
jgi:hypothetical protein